MEYRITVFASSGAFVEGEWIEHEFYVAHMRTFRQFGTTTVTEIRRIR